MSHHFRSLLIGLLLLTFVLPASMVAAAPDAPTAVLTVTNTNDSGAGSFRQAIIQSNATAGKDTIQFNIPSAGTHVITLAAALQAITDPVIIDGTTQSDASCLTWPPTLRIVLNGSGAGAATSGLVITGGDTIVKGLVIQRFGDHGVVFQGSGGNQVDCSFIGTNSSGDLPNFGNDIGVFINNSANNIVSRSVIAGNGTYGVYISGAGNQVRGSYIGTNKSGSAALANGSEGILVQGGANTQIGSSTPALRNIISGNNGHGVSIAGPSAGTKVQGNYIGTNASGSAALPNTHSGVVVAGVANVTIGGNVADAGNVISGNDDWGVRLQTGANNASIERNIIGRSANQASSIANGNGGVSLDQAPNNRVGSPGNGNIISANQGEGIYVFGTAASGNVIQANSISGNSFFGVRLGFAPDNLVGGLFGGQENAIAGNANDGVYVEGPTATGNRLLRNSTFNNGGLGIDLGDSDVTPNDPGDADTGANNLQNFPALTSAGTGGGFIVVNGTLNSKPNTTYRLEFFFNDVGTCDPSGHGEGRYFLGASDVTTDGAGNVGFIFSATASLSAGRPVVATATDPAGNTSEFSACRNLVGFVPVKTFLPFVAR